MILVIDKTRKSAEAISGIFRYMGILSIPSDAKDAPRLVTPGCKAVLFVDTNTFPACSEVIRKLPIDRTRTPVFALTDENHAAVYDKAISPGKSSSEILFEINDYMRRVNLPPLGEYVLGGIDASVTNPPATCFGIRLPFTKTELMVLRYLMKNYPLPKSAKDILSNAFIPSRTPEIGGVRTHVSIMNKKFRAIHGRSIIHHVPDQGYVILTTETARIYGIDLRAECHA